VISAEGDPVPDRRLAAALCQPVLAAAPRATAPLRGVLPVSHVPGIPSGCHPAASRVERRELGSSVGLWACRDWEPTAALRWEPSTLDQGILRRTLMDC